MRYHVDLGKKEYIQSNLLPRMKVILHRQCLCVRDNFSLHLTLIYQSIKKQLDQETWLCRTQMAIPLWHIKFWPKIYLLFLESYSRMLIMFKKLLIMTSRKFFHW